MVHCQGSGIRKSIRRHALARARAGHQALEQRQAAGAGGREVDVRVGAVGDQRVAVRDHGLGQVGVQVERADDRQIGPTCARTPAEQLALAVVQVLGDHGAVQVEEQGVERAGGGQVVQQHRRQPLERVLGHRPGGARIGPDQRHELVPGGRARRR